MKYLFFCGIFLLCSKNTLAADSKNDPHKAPQWYQDYEKACTPDFTSVKCQAAFVSILSNDVLWGDVSKNIKKGDLVWKEEPLNLELVTDDDKEGEFSIILNNGKPMPFLRLSSKKSLLPEILLTVNHELVHYANSKELVETIPKRNDFVDNCITEYQKVVLKDENRAIKSELDFWNSSPPWFKEKLKNIRFNSKFTGLKQSSYKEHYAYIESQFQKDELFGSTMYIRLGEYPSCSQKIITNSHKFPYQKVPKNADKPLQPPGASP